MFVFVYFVLAWLSGLVCGWFITMPSHGIIFQLGLLLIVLIILILPGKSILLIRHGFLWSLIAAFLTGWCVIVLRYPNPNFSVGSKYRSIGKVLKHSTNTYRDQLVISLLQCCDGHDTILSPCRFLLEMPPGNIADPVEKGDTVQLYAYFTPLKARKTVGEFGERGYWAGFGVRYKATVKGLDVKLIGKGSEKYWSNSIHKIRQEIIMRISSFDISKSNRSIIAAMLIGDKKGLDRSQKQVFSTIGIMHLLAVSGLHVGIVFLVLTKILTLVGLSGHGPLNRLVSIMFVWIYVLVCGMPPSAVRAAGMLSLFGLTRWAGRPVNTIHLLALICFVHTLIEPVSIFSTGFQLSYLAILGILIYFPRIKDKLHTKSWILYRVRDLAAISLSAQILTLPVVLFVFASFPVYFMLANILLVPLGLLIFYFSLVVLIVHGFGVQSTVLFRFLEWVMDLWINLGRIIAGLPGSSIVVLNFPIYECLFYAGLLLVLRNSVRKSLLPPFSLLIYIAAWSVVGFFFIIYNKL